MLCFLKQTSAIWNIVIGKQEVRDSGGFVSIKKGNFFCFCRPILLPEPENFEAYD